MKKSLAFLIVAAMLAVLCLGAQALELETVETPQESAASGEQTALKGEIDITSPSALKNPSYGTLIYYNDFDGYESTTVGNLTTGHTYVGGILEGNTVALNGGNANLSIAVDPADETKTNQVLKVYELGGYARANLKFGTHLTNIGNYTIVMDIYVPSNNTSADINALVYINDDGNSHSVYNFNATARDAWNADKAAGGFQVLEAADAGASNSGKGKCFDNVYLCDRRGTIASGSIYYIDNLRVYYTPRAKAVYNVNLPEGQAKAYNMKTSTSTAYAAFSTVSEYVNIGSATPELFIPGYTFMGWYNSEGTRVSYITEHSELTAKWQKVKPGLNALTGTTDKVTYENNDDFHFIFEGGMSSKAVTANDIKETVGGNTSNRAVKAYGTSMRYIVYRIPVPTDAGRKYEVSWDTYISNGYTGVTGWLLDFKGAGSHVTLDGSAWNTANNTNKTWYSHNYTASARAADYIRIQYKFADDGETNSSYAYFDNLAVFPYYMINYLNADGSVKETVQVLRESDGSFSTSYTVKNNNYPGAVLDAETKMIKRCIGWSTEPNAAEPITAVALANEDITLYPVWENVIPAQNESYGELLWFSDFTNGSTQTALYIKSGYNIVANPLALNKWAVTDDPAGVAGNKVLQMTKGGQYAGYILGYPNDLKEQGKYTVVADVYYGDDFSGTPNVATTFYTNGYNDHRAETCTVSSKKVWTTIAGTREAVQYTDVTGVTFTFDKEGNPVAGNKKSYPAAWFDQTYIFDAAGIGTSNIYYLDNVRLYYLPTCRVAYNYGEIPPSSITSAKTYQYLTEGASVLAGLNAESIGYTFKGWTKDAEPTSESVLYTTVTADDIAAKDITLYAVLEPIEQDYEVTASATAVSAVSGSITFTANQFTAWSYDVGYSEATVATTANTLKITAVGYAGEITVTATSKITGDAKSFTVNLYSGSKFKPGLDVVTGTSKPVTFENMTAALAALCYTGNYELVANPNASGLNTSAQAMSAKGNFEHLRWTTSLTTPIELARPMKVSYDYYGKAANNWIMLNSTRGSQDIYKTIDNMSTNTTTWKHFENNAPLTLSGDVKKEHGARGILWMGVEVGGYTADNRYTVDNLSFIPYYKFTFSTFDGQVIDVQYALPADGIYEPSAEYLASLGVSGFYLEKGGELVTKVTLDHKDLTLYVDTLTKSYNESSICVNSPYGDGIRFHASVNPAQRELAKEYGFLVARQDVLETLGQELTFDLADPENAAAVVFVTAVSYKNDNSVDKIYAIEEDTGITHFTGVCINIPTAAYAYRLTARPYIKYEIGGTEVTLYGTAVSRSMKQVAEDVRTENSEYYQNNKDAIDAIADC